MATNNKKIETPGAQDTALDNAQENKNNIENNAKSIDELIAQNQATLDDVNASAELKSVAQIKINELLEAKKVIDETLTAASSALESIKAQAQTKAAIARKTELTNVNINKSKVNVLKNARMTLTDAGYVVNEG